MYGKGNGNGSMKYGWYKAETTLSYAPTLQDLIHRTHPFPSHNHPSDEALGLVWWIKFFCNIHKKRNNSIMKHKIITFISQQTSQVYVQGVERRLMIFTSILNNMVLLMSCIFLSKRFHRKYWHWSSIFFFCV